MDLHLEGKVVILTGGFKGIGKGIALRLAKEGTIVAVINRDDGTAEQFDAEMKAITDNYRTYLMDLNDTDDIAPIVEDVVKTYGHIDGLVNNAGRNDNLDLDHTSWREFEQSLHGNLTHYYELGHRMTTSRRSRTRPRSCCPTAPRTPPANGSTWTAATSTSTAPSRDRRNDGRPEHPRSR